MLQQHRLFMALVFSFLLPPIPAAIAAEKSKLKIAVLQTTKGTRFGIFGTKKDTPSPILFVFAGSPEDTLANSSYNKIGFLLAKQGFLCVSLDLPCHGKDTRNKEDQGLTGWRKRLEQGDKLVRNFTRKASDVLDYLIKEKYADAKQVFVCGTSRGGFMALQFAAADSRIRGTAAFAPVTNLLALSEFAGIKNQAFIEQLALHHRDVQLAGRPIWIAIGNYDLRVSTDDALTLARQILKTSTALKKVPALEFHLTHIAGHRIHPTAHDEAAAWVLKMAK